MNVGAPLFTLLAGASNSPAGVPATKAPAPAQAETQIPAKASSPAPISAGSIPAKSTPVNANTPATAPASTRTETRVKMTRMRQRIAQRLKEAQNTAAMLTTFQEVDMTNLMALRSKYKDDFEKVHGVKLGFMSAFVKVCSCIHHDTSYFYCTLTVCGLRRTLMRISHTSLVGEGGNSDAPGDPSRQRSDRRRHPRNRVSQLLRCVRCCRVSHWTCRSRAEEHGQNDLRGMLTTHRA